MASHTWRGVIEVRLVTGVSGSSGNEFTENNNNNVFLLLKE